MDFYTALMQLMYCPVHNGLGTVAYLLMQSIKLYALRSNFILWREGVFYSVEGSERW